MSSRTPGFWADSGRFGAGLGRFWVGFRTDLGAYFKKQNDSGTNSNRHSGGPDAGFGAPGGGFGGPGGGFLSNNSSSGLPPLLLPLQPPPGLQKPVPGPPGSPRDSSQSIVHHIYIYIHIICIYVYTVLTAYQDENQDDYDENRGKP